jgi:hypothetical protein
MFSVSADSEPHLQTVVARVKQLIEKTKADLQTRMVPAPFQFPHH